MHWDGGGAMFPSGSNSGGNGMNALADSPLDFNPRRPWWGGDLQTIRNYAIDAGHALPSRARRAHRGAAQGRQRRSPGGIAASAHDRSRAPPRGPDPRPRRLREQLLHDRRDRLLPDPRLSGADGQPARRRPVARRLPRRVPRRQQRRLRHPARPPQSLAHAARRAAGRLLAGRQHAAEVFGRGRPAQGWCGAPPRSPHPSISPPARAR